jgi:hypothetical protein
MSGLIESIPSCISDNNHVNRRLYCCYCYKLFCFWVSKTSFQFFF